MRLLVIIVFLFISFNGKSQSFQYSLRTNPTGMSEFKTLFIKYKCGERTITDSFSLKKGSFLQKINIPYPVPASVSLQPGDKTVECFLANNILTINIETDSWNLADNTILSKQWKQLTLNDSLRQSYFPAYYQRSQENDSMGLNQLRLIFDSLQNDDCKAARKFIESNPSSPVVLSAFLRLASVLPSYSDALDYFNILPSWAKASPEGRLAKAKIQGSISTVVGSIRPRISGKLISGDKFEDSTLFGKYVLVDFWASWCGPCRKKHPALSNLYQKYTSENVSFISVSLDTSFEDWKTAVEKDAIPWTQVSDLNGFESSNAVRFGVQAIPSNFFIDPSGNIVGKNLSLEDIEKMLNQFIKKK